MAYEPLKTFRDLGVEIDLSSVVQQVTDCPFCNKENHFYINSQNGCWDCKRCGKAGNIRHFIRFWLELMEHRTSADLIQNLAAERGVRGSTLQDARFVYDAITNQWWFPVHDLEGKVFTLRRWSKKSGMMALSGIPTQLYGVERLKGIPRNAKIWLCEGEWDSLAMTELLKLSGYSDRVVALPGARTFKREWSDLFMDSRTTICGDNDDAGDDMAEKATTLLVPHRVELDYLNWPPSLPVGYDLRDFIKDRRYAGVKAKQILEEIIALTAKESRRVLMKKAEEEDKAKGTRHPIAARLTDEVATFPEVIETFSKWMLLDDDLIGAIALSLAVCISNQIPGEPLWMYLVGPSGSGKTEILLAMQDSSRTIFRSSLTTAALVSGFHTGKDPSLIPMMNNKTAIFKDGTEILTLPHDSRQMIYSTLRGAYDGHVFKQFGNISREYKNLHFNLLIGVTPEIHRDNTAMLGERFMKYQMRDSGNVEAKIRAAIGNTGHEQQKLAELNEVCKKFLRRSIDGQSLPHLSPTVVEKIVPLAQYVSTMQSQVSREPFSDRAMTHRPTHAFGTRVGKQLTKLSRVLAAVLDKGEVDDTVYELIFKVGLDSCVGFHQEIVQLVVDSDPAGKGVFRTELQEKCSMSTATLSRRLDDLEDLKILHRTLAPVVEGRRGPIPSMWSVAPHLRDYWARMRPTTYTPEPHLNGTPTPMRRGPKIGP